MIVELARDRDLSSTLAQGGTHAWALGGSICLISLLASACGAHVEDVGSNRHVVGSDASTSLERAADSAAGNTGVLNVDAGAKPTDNTDDPEPESDLTSDSAIATGTRYPETLPTQSQLTVEAVGVGNGDYVAVGSVNTGAETDSVILTSQDGISWGLSYRGGDEWLHAVAFGNGHWVTVGSRAHNDGANSTSSARYSSPMTPRLGTLWLHPKQGDLTK